MLLDTYLEKQAIEKDAGLCNKLLRYIPTKKGEQLERVMLKHWLNRPTDSQLAKDRTAEALGATSTTTKNWFERRETLAKIRKKYFD